MSKSKSPTLGRSRRDGRFTLSWQGISKLNAVEGIKLSRASQDMFAEFERSGASAEQRRRMIVARHGRKA